jgi:hypothetical protein
MMISLTDQIRIPNLHVIRIDVSRVPTMQSMVENPWHIVSMHNSENQRFLWIEIF